MGGRERRAFEYCSEDGSLLAGHKGAFIHLLGTGLASYTQDVVACFKLFADKNGGMRVSQEEQENAIKEAAEKVKKLQEEQENAIKEAAEKVEMAAEAERSAAEESERVALERAEAEERIAIEKAGVAERIARERVEAAERVIRERAEAAEREVKAKAEAVERAERIALEKAAKAKQDFKEKVRNNAKPKLSDIFKAFETVEDRVEILTSIGWTVNKYLPKGWLSHKAEVKRIKVVIMIIIITIIIMFNIIIIIIIITIIIIIMINDH